MRHFLILACLLLLAACGRTPVQEQQAFVFGTRVEVLVVSADPAQGRQAIASVLREFDRMHRAYHAWQPSELSDLNLAIAQGRPQQVSPELAGFISEAQDLSRQGDYLFDPGIGQLIRLWGFQADEFKAEVPPAADIAVWLANKPSIANLKIAGNTITSSNRHVALDFGGYLKGVALDRAAAILREQGIHNALINIGGNVMALGSKEGRKWRVGIQHPRQPGPMATVALEDGSSRHLGRLPALLRSRRQALRPPARPAQRLPGRPHAGRHGADSGGSEGRHAFRRRLQTNIYRRARRLARDG